MGSPKKNLLKKLLAIAIAATYALIATAHIFYLPNYNNAGTKTHLIGNSIFTEKAGSFLTQVDSLNLTRLIDKSTLEDKKIIAELMLEVVKYFFILLFIPLVCWLQPKLLFSKFRQLINYQGFYLSICTLKI